MKRRIRIAATIFLVLATAGPLAAESPLTIGFPGFDPFWVDVRVAVTPDGQFDPRYFGDPVYDGFVEQVTRARCDPVPIGMSFVDYLDARLCDDFECAIRSADLIVGGTVVGRTFGFYGGEPGQMLEIRPDVVFKGERRKSSLFAFYPVAEFCAGTKTIVKTDERWPDPPPVGGEVFLFSGGKPSDDGWVQTEYEEDVVPVARDGHLAFGVRSRFLGTAGPATADDLVAEIRAVADTREQRLKHARAPDDMPYLLYSSGNLYPEWVDARIALGDDGRIDRSLFPDDALARLQSAVSETAPPGATFRVGEVDAPPAYFRPEATLGEAAEKTDLLVLAHVTNRSFGFWIGIPGELLRLEVERTYRGVPTLDEAYLFVPQGDFELGPYRIVKSDRRYPEPPGRGGEVFLFTYPHVRADLFVPLDGRGLVPVDSDGRLVLGADYRAGEEASDRPLRTKQDLVARIEEANGANPPSR